MVRPLLASNDVLANRRSEAGVANVLILEDNNENRSFLRMLFEGEGFSVATVANGADGLIWLNQHPAPSVIVLDLQMPIMNGWEFCEALQYRKHLAGIPLVVLSAEADARDATRSLPAPSTYLEKPAIPEVLVRTVVSQIRASDRAT
jgi:CheY-like chemotaxis protein